MYIFEANFEPQFDLLYIGFSSEKVITNCTQFSIIKIKTVENVIGRNAFANSEKEQCITSSLRKIY